MIPSIDGAWASAATKRRRPYDSQLRREQAVDTRRRILQTAQECFERDGYVATSMAAIASAAGVSLKTALNHPSLYTLLVGGRGWSPERYEQWLGDLLSERLLGARPR